jgi:hypothetical protein
MNNTNNQLISGLQDMTYNTNGGLAYVSSGSCIIDFYYKLSVLLKKNDMQSLIDHGTVDSLWENAKKENALAALATLLYTRSITDSGLGNRFFFRHIFKEHLLSQKPEAAVALMVTGVKKGWLYWKDFFDAYEYSLVNKLPIRNAFTEVVKTELNAPVPDNLFYKWFPRKGRIFQYCKSLVGTPTQLRKQLTSVPTVESMIGKGAFSEIDYSKVPSKSYKRNTVIFEKYDSERFESFVKKVVKGETSVKADAIYPHEILRGKGTSEAKEAQWMSMPDLVKDPSKMFLPVLDCSGSMKGMPMEICHALGIYLSERNKSVFKDNVLTFSNRPFWIQLTGSLMNKAHQLKAFSEVAGTNFESVFELMLTTAVQRNVPQSDFPTHLICLTDGQFNMMSSNNSSTVLSAYRQKFKEAGYVLPQIVFWNLAVNDSVPEKASTPGVTLVAGASPNAFTNALNGLTTEEMLNLGIAPFMEAASTYINS